MGINNLVVVDLLNIEAETSQPGINIDKQDIDKHEVHSCVTTLVRYDHEHLINIGKQVKGDRRLKLLDCNAVRIIRSLRLNRRGVEVKERSQD